MVNTTTEEQTKEINTVLSSLQEKYGGERESFDAGELLSIIDSVNIIHKIYHSNAVLNDGREGLLVDTGAVFNLTGDAWLHRMSEHLPKELPIQYEELQEPQGVMGVGQHASTATHVAAVPMGMAEQGIEPDENFKYKATVITNSDVPALLGLQSMIASNCILDLRPGKMHMYTSEDANAIEITFSPKNGHKVGRLKMAKAQSGHLMLPCSQFEAVSTPTTGKISQSGSSTVTARSRSSPAKARSRISFRNPPMPSQKLTVPVGLVNSKE